MVDTVIKDSFLDLETKCLARNTLHNDMHTPIQLSDNAAIDGDQEQEVLLSNFSRDIFGKVHWNSSNDFAPCSGPCEDVTNKDAKLLSKDSICTFTWKNRDLAIREVKLKLRLPAVQCKDPNVRITRCYNSALHCIKWASFTLGTLTETINTDVIITWNEWLTPMAARSIIRRSLGNEKLKYSKFLPEQDKISFSLPFLFSYDDSSALPMYLTNESFVVKLQYQTNPHVSFVKAIRIAQDGTEEQLYGREIAGLLEAKNMVKPEIYLSGCILNKPELMEERAKQLIVIPVRSMISVTAPNNMGAGLKDSLPLLTEHPVLAHFFKALNVRSELYNDPSNYTDDIYNEDGESAINVATLLYGSEEKWVINWSDCNNFSPTHAFLGYPKPVGMFAKAFSANPMLENGFSGLIYDAALGAKIQISLSDRDAEINSYKFQVLLMVQRDLVFKYDSIRKCHIANYGKA